MSWQKYHKTTEKVIIQKKILREKITTKNVKFYLKHILKLDFFIIIEKVHILNHF
jgi:hypothetical protein